MLDRQNAAMVDRAVEAAADESVDRVVANLRAAREPVYDPTDPIQVAAVERLRSETAAPTPGERLVASVQQSYDAHRLIADRRGYGRTGRLPCGSLRDHAPHTWTGQTAGQEFRCSGHPPTFPERSQLADRRLHEETNGITDSWREDL